MLEQLIGKVQQCIAQGLRDEAIIQCICQEYPWIPPDELLLVAFLERRKMQECVLERIKPCTESLRSLYPTLDTEELHWLCIFSLLELQTGRLFTRIDFQT